MDTLYISKNIKCCNVRDYASKMWQHRFKHRQNGILHNPQKQRKIKLNIEQEKLTLKTMHENGQITEKKMKSQT